MAITVHFNAARLEYLAEVLRSLAEFPVAAMTVVLLTNTVQDEELAVLERLCDEILAGKTVSIRSYEFLAHPHYLTWRHRELIATDFMDGRYTHFIYLEDDIRLSYVNFSYFVEYRDILRDSGLLPSFLRVEYSKALNGFVNSDNQGPVDVSRRPRIEIGDIVMTNIPNPYTACYILDVELADEFRRSRSFKRGKSRAVSNREVRERAAMGLCYENIPDSFESRYVVPVSSTTSTVLNCAWISHLPNNYADDPESVFGKIRMDALALNAGGSASADCAENVTAKIRARRTDQGRIKRCMVIPGKIIEGLRWRLGLRR